MLKSQAIFAQCIKSHRQPVRAELQHIHRDVTHLLDAGNPQAANTLLRRLDQVITNPRHSGNDEAVARLELESCLSDGVELSPQARATLETAVYQKGHDSEYSRLISDRLAQIGLI